MNLRVLLALHHRVASGGGDPPGGTLALGSALSDLGCRVDYFGYEHAFGDDSVDSMGSRLHFPWRLSSYLKRRASEFDVLDITAGDGWVWARRGRTGGGKTPVLIARSDGLEQTADFARRADARAGRLALSWKYPLYHGGFRLWEVRQSLQRCDQAILSNNRDRDFALDRLGLSPLRVSVIGSGLPRRFMGLWPPAEIPAQQRVKLIAAGEWSDKIGKRCLIKIAAQLHAEAAPFSLTLLGTVWDEVEVSSEFPPELRPYLRVIPQCRSVEVPGILLDHHALLICGESDFRSPTLPEAMACGLAPIARRTPDTARIIIPGKNGELIDPADFEMFAGTVARLAQDRMALHNMRLAAQHAAQRHEWPAIAAATLDIYQAALQRARGVDVPRSAPPVSTNMRSDKPALSICICTANRPAVLRRCLASIEQGNALPAEVVVGDDTLDGAETAGVCREFPFVRYVRGPRRGLCANRNVVVAAATGSYVALLDDDSEVTPQFVRLAQELTAHSDGRTIFTGDVMEDGVDRVAPSNPTFWGHSGTPLAVMGRCETVNLNSNIFPRSAFDHARFDERIVYGYEAIDLCQQMLGAGYKIEYRRELVNLHLPPPKTAEVLRSQGEQAERARYYTTLKRYMLWQARPLRAFVYAGLAPLHQAAHHVIHRQLSQALVGFSDMSWAVHQALEFRKAARESQLRERTESDFITARH